MSFYWETAQPQRKPRSNGTRIIALIIIIMVVVSTGLVFIGNYNPTNTSSYEPVRVAVIDSGVDIDFSLQGRVVAEQSFVTVANGYPSTDLTVSDSRPDNVPHGTLIAKQIATIGNTLIINAKVMGDDGSATTMALVEAIHWVVEQNASVINLSLGGTPTLGDPIEDALNWAFSQGVVITTSAGNSGDSGIPGTTVESPAVFDVCIAVGALSENGELADYSSTGPTREKTMKPDICAPGYITDSSGTRYYGTSFSAPRVAGAAAALIGYCLTNNITYTPGTIMTALLKGADSMAAYPDYEVGAGKLNLQQSLYIIEQTSLDGELPIISYAFPGTLPIDFERLFEGDTYSFDIRLLTSGYTTFDVEIDSDTPSVFIIENTIEVNQTARVPITVEIPDSGATVIQGNITFTSPDFGVTELTISIDVGTSVGRVAFDISHTPWDLDTIYGQFREFYKVLVDNDISVTEIRNSSLTTLSFLQQFDAVVLLDPCVYSRNETIPTSVTDYSLPFSETEIHAYEDYYNAGGGLFVVGLSESVANLTALNEFLDWTGFTMTSSEVPSGDTPALIDDIDSHIITSGVNSFHYLGATIQILGDGHGLARYGIMPVMGYKEGTGRLVVTGSNYMLDNWALLGEYGEADNGQLVLRIVLWCSGLLV
ncbi:MAG: S8 family serine peptidase [Candidatus Thorarchaeota archaeon]|nr:S8 family serine peptidase [Candidatus Thorarchaeota archaeon]